MTFKEFLSEFDALVQIFGESQFPQPMLERTHYKVQDLNRNQLRELVEILIDSCEFAPKVPRVVETANIVRARHREGVREAIPIDDGPRTPEVARRALATITNILRHSRTIPNEGETK